MEEILVDMDYACTLSRDSDMMDTFADLQVGLDLLSEAWAIRTNTSNRYIDLRKLNVKYIRVRGVTKILKFDPQLFSILNGEFLSFEKLTKFIQRRYSSLISVYLVYEELKVDNVGCDSFDTASSHV